MIHSELYPASLHSPSLPLGLTHACFPATPSVTCAHGLVSCCSHVHCYAHAWSRAGFDVSDLPTECFFGYLTSVYFVLITIFSVGYGDIVPVTNGARVIVLSILVPLFFILLNEVNRLSDIYKSQSKYNAPFEGSPYGHVIVCGQMHVRGGRASVVSCHCEHQRYC
jgi:hypothetical protein